MKNVKKILCTIAAAAAAVSMMAVNVFAATITLDSEYPGNWKAGKCIPKADLEALGGDVKIVLTVEIKEPLVGEHLHHLRPINHDADWTGFTDQLQSDTAYAKDDDGNFVLSDGQTSVEFIIPADVISTLADGGLGFMVSNVIVKSADITKADAPQGPIKRLTSEEAEKLTVNEYGVEAAEAEAAPEETEAAPAETDAAPAEDAAADESADEPAAPAETAAPAAVEPAAAEPVAVTASPATGNTAVMAIAAVMAVSGAAAIASKKRK